MESPQPIKPEAGIGTIKALVLRVQQVGAILDPEPTNVTTHIRAVPRQSCHLPLRSGSLQALGSALTLKSCRPKRALREVREKLDM